jgi:hypothetical protein
MIIKHEEVEMYLKGSKGNFVTVRIKIIKSFTREGTKSNLAMVREQNIECISPSLSHENM